MLKKSLSCLFILLFLAACQENLVYSKFQAAPNGLWKDDQTLHFEITDLDSVQPYNLYINIRNDENYAFSNLFLITELENPDGNTVKDTLEYEMAKPTGEWLGSGMGSTKENKLWYKENVVFRDSGVYKVRISHAMRKNGAAQGIQFLSGITDIGLQIEKSTD